MEREHFIRKFTEEDYINYFGVIYKITNKFKVIHWSDSGFSD